MTKAKKLFKTLVLGGIALATSTTLGACDGDGPREGPDGGPPPSDTGREGPDVGPPPLDAAIPDAGIREGLDVGPPLDAYLAPPEDAASSDDAGAADDGGSPDAPASSG
jgi:hypothetical protein